MSDSAIKVENQKKLFKISFSQTRYATMGDLPACMFKRCNGNIRSNMTNQTNVLYRPEEPDQLKTLRFEFLNWLKNVNKYC